MSDVIQYKCPRCGGVLEFDPALQKMRCPYCESVFTTQELESADGGIGAVPEAEQDDFTAGNEAMELSGASWTNDENAHMRVYGCKSCGAEIIADETTGATHCPYCGNVVVMTGQFSGDLKPDLVIPFKITKEQAVDQFKKHITSSKYVPKVFSAQGHPEEIKGVYVPFWLFDADVNANVTYNAERIRTWSDRHYNYTETEHYVLKRAGTIRMEKVPADGSSKMADDLMESIEPYDVTAAVPFTTAYLAGYLADRYDVPHTACKDRVQDRMRLTAETEMRGTVSGYTGVRTAATHVTWDRAKVSYALYPVWLLNTQYDGQNYLFAMNGQTGKFVGNLPLDKSHFTKARWKYFAVITAAAFIGLTLLETFLL